MRTQATRVISAVAAAGALTALVLAGTGAGAVAAPASSGRGQTTAAVPANFEPVSASFWSPAQGVALGGVGCAGGSTCTARLAVTADGGARWHFLNAPDAPVTVVMFASPHDGWLYGQTGQYGEYGAGLWATHDGGGHWRELSLAGGVIESMAASAGIAYAVVSPPGGLTDELFASPAGRNAWARVGDISVSTDTGSALAVSGRSAWFGGGTSVWATADGVHWDQYPFACPGSYGLQSIAAASPSDLVFLCTGESFTGHTEKEVLRSANGGKTEHLAGPAPLGGVGGVIAVPPRASAVITLAAEYFLYRSADGGKTWKTVLFYDGGATWSSLSYVSGTVGSVVVSSAGQWLLRTTDAGLTWHRIAF